LRLKEGKYAICQGVLYKSSLDGTFLRCVDVEQQKELMKVFIKMHVGDISHQQSHLLRSFTTVSIGLTFSKTPIAMSDIVRNASYFLENHNLVFQTL